MIKQLRISNYAIIEQLDIEFYPGLSIITGETGAGKSILLGALSLILGQRADTSVLLKEGQKCIVEGSFDLSGMHLEDFFESEDLDYENPAILRREILPSGKSRAFINDTPVALAQLHALALNLVDIHSQHQNLNLGDHEYQRTILDAYAGNNELLEEYREKYHRFLDLQQEYRSLQEKSGKAAAEQDYLQFQLEQFEETKLQKGEQEGLEQEQEQLSHAEEIKSALFQAANMLNGEEHSAYMILQKALQQISSIARHHHPSGELQERLNSIVIELKDIAAEADQHAGKIEYDPARLELISERLDLIYQLQKKHAVRDLDELLATYEDIKNKLQDIRGYEEQLSNMEKKLEEMTAELEDLSGKLRKKRKACTAGFKKTVLSLLVQLGIPNARFEIDLQALDEFTPNGKDEVGFLFSANKQSALHEISRVASGGELSRLMLSIKSLMAGKRTLPTIIFDEIDAGVSGEIADKVGNIIREMALYMQVFNITHLPQVAVKGDHHYLVYKSDQDNKTLTHIRKLSHEDRIIELAKMLSGEELTEAAISNAKELLRNS